jgi:c(7)-type cytochrome triheme protein
MTTTHRLALGLSVLLAAGAAPAQEGKKIYEQKCAVCHSAGLAGAPRPGNSADWAPRLKAGRAALVRSAMQGTSRGMPAKGGDLSLSEGAVRAAVEYMLGGAAFAAKPATPKPAASAAPTAAAPSAAAAAVPAAAAAAATPSPTQATQSIPAAEPAPQTAVAKPSVLPLPEPGSGSADSNSFNRLLRPVGKRNLAPAQDGIHDASVDGTHQLQAPLAAFGALPRANAGNRVDWVKALAQNKIAPRWERDKPEASATVMDLNIVREVKGSMPDVVYPHKQHTEWLDCSNCHPAIFVPQKGANQMSMAAILLGQGCGTCHGKVAFPVSECRLCHSKKKDGAASAASAAPVAERK